MWGTVFKQIQKMSKAPKKGYARTPTADGGYEFHYRAARLKPAISMLICLAALALFVVVSFSNFDLMGFAFIAVMAFILVFGMVFNVTDRSFSVYPDRIVTTDGGTVPFDDITHLGWDANKSTFAFPKAVVTAQALGRTINIVGYVKPVVAMGLHTEIKKVSDIRFS